MVRTRLISEAALGNFQFVVRNFINYLTSNKGALGIVIRIF